MQTVIETLSERVAELRSWRVAMFADDLPAAQAVVAEIERKIAEHDTAILETEAAITALGGQVPG